MGAHKERFIQNILDAVTDSIVLVDRSGAVQMLNKAAAGRLRLAPEPAVGTTTIVPPGLIESGLPYIRQVVRSKRPIRIESENEGMVLATEYHPLFDSLGRVSHVAIFGREPTDLGHAGLRSRPEHGPEISPDPQGSTFQQVAIPMQLTTAETRVLHLVLEGKSNKEIALLLHRSVRTVEVHRSRIMHKLNAHNVVQLVRQATCMDPLEAETAG